MNGWQRNGRNPQWTTDQMMDALKRVQNAEGFCGIKEYRRHCLPTDPTAEGIIARFGTWNRAKIKAGLPICVKTVKERLLIDPDEVELEQPTLTTYPCHKCRKLFKGRGRRNGNWFCELCVRANNEMAANMAWLG